MARRLTVYATILFVLAFPAVGLVVVWNDGHGRLRRSAVAAADGAIPEFLGPQGRRAMRERGTVDFRQSAQAEEAARVLSTLGAMRRAQPARAVGSRSGSRRDYVWQFVDLEARAEFEKGPATVRLTMARQTMAPEWRLDKLTVERAGR
jgi:hypothetical protein